MLCALASRMCSTNQASALHNTLLLLLLLLLLCLQIYRQMEMLSFVSDSLAVARRNKGDVDVILFVKLQEGHVLDDDAITLIKVCSSCVCAILSRNR
jgi:hypothetical protein